MTHKNNTFTCLIFCLLTSSTLCFAADSCPSVRTPHHYSSVHKQFTCFDKWQEKIFAQIGCPIQFTYSEFISGARVMNQLEYGEIDFLIGLSITEERKNYLHFSKPFGESRIYFYALKTKPSWLMNKSWCDAVMKKARVLIPSTGYFGPDIEKLRDEQICVKETLTFNNGISSAVGMLERDRADLLLLSDDAYNSLKPDMISKIERTKYIIWRDQVHFAFRKETTPPEFVERLNRTIMQDLKENGAPCGLAEPSN